MRITYKGDYALKAMLALALQYEQSVVTIHDLAQRIDGPIKFLEQVLLDLKRGGFVESRRGKVGGYTLAKRPQDITVGAVIRFIDGPVEPIACVEKNYTECRDINKCLFRPLWQSVASATSGIIDTITFAELVSQVIQKQKVIDYSI